MTDTKWLSPEEREAWIPISLLTLFLPSHLEDALACHDLTFFDYTALVVLSNVDGRTIPMSHLAHLSSGSLSRTSHAARRLEKRGLLRRHRCPEDGRVTLVTLTDEGHQKLAAAAPDHVDSVRAAIFDALTPAQAAELGRLSRIVAEKLNPGCPPAPEDCDSDQA